MSFFGVDIPKSSEVSVKIRFVTGRGQPFIAWDGCAEASESDVLTEMSKSPTVCAYIKRAAENGRIKMNDEDGTYPIPAKILCYESGQLIDEKAAQIDICPLESDDKKKKKKKSSAVKIIKTLVTSLTEREAHVTQMLQQVDSMRAGYERTITAISKQAMESMDKVSNHAATAFSAAAAPFADMSKSLVKSLDDSRTSSATNAKESHDLLIEALRNRIIESNQVSKTSVANDIKEVMQLWPMFKGLLGEAEGKPPA